MAGYFNQHLDDEQLTDHDRPLGFHWNVPGLARELGLCLPRKLEAAVSSVLAEAILAAESGKAKAVSYSRNRNFYANSRRYRGTEYTYSTVLASVALLHRAGWIVDCPAPPGQLGWQSSLVATDELIRAWHRFAPPIAYSQSEIIWLKDNAGNLVNYIDTRNTWRLRHQLAECNEHMAQLAIEIPDAERQGRHISSTEVTSCQSQVIRCGAFLAVAAFHCMADSMAGINRSRRRRGRPNNQRRARGRG